MSVTASCRAAADSRVVLRDPENSARTLGGSLPSESYLPFFDNFFVHKRECCHQAKDVSPLGSNKSGESSHDKVVWVTPPKVHDSRECRS